LIFEKPKSKKNKNVSKNYTEVIEKK